MTLTTPISKVLSLAALTAVAAFAALGGTASAATIGEREVLRPGQKIPIDFPGYREPANRRLPANYRIVRVHVEVARGERASTVLTAPRGFRMVTIGFGNGDEIGGSVADVRYPGERSVRVHLSVNPNLVERGGTGQGTVYLLARRA